ncbi:MAG TPA: hypothetical protein VMK66_03050 [Myxococcales bacterium]|nr:hypothetical protein [Myxococcales bacterium]
MRCPVCETENQGAQCTNCGRALDPEGGSAEEVAPLEGLEATQLAPLDLAVQVEPLPGVEHTRLEQMDVRQNWFGGPMPLERTEHEPAPDAEAGSASDPDLDPGREKDGGERTPAPEETAVCPFCGTPSLDAICDNCGRRKFRSAPAEEEGVARGAATGETAVCPACFARVLKDVRCSDCGMPFPLSEL